MSLPEKAAKVRQAINEYKELDHEDTIGDLSTRFKYTTSAPTNFGLTPVEILLATDAELNALVSVKHIAPYRSGGMGAGGKGFGKKVRELREGLKQRRWGEEYVPPREDTDHGYSRRGEGAGHAAGEGESREARKGKRKGKKERMRERAAVVEGAEAVGGLANGHGTQSEAPGAPGSSKSGAGDENSATAPEGGKKRRKKRKHNEVAQA